MAWLHRSAPFAIAPPQCRSRGERFARLPTCRSDALSHRATTAKVVPRARQLQRPQPRSARSIGHGNGVDLRTALRTRAAHAQPCHAGRRCGGQIGATDRPTRTAKAPLESPPIRAGPYLYDSPGSGSGGYHLSNTIPTARTRLALSPPVSWVSSLAMYRPDAACVPVSVSPSHVWA